MRSQWISLIVLLLLMIAGCTKEVDRIPTESLASPSQESISTPQTDYLPQGDIATMIPIPTTPATSNLQNLIKKAKKDLSQRLSISEPEIKVLEARDIVWSNSSLGCPQPGMLYADVLTPGYLILLSANGREYEYHTGKNTDVFLCENPIPPVPGTPDNI